MDTDRTRYVIPVIIACIALVIGFGFLVDAGSASAGSDALEDAILNGSVEGTVVLDDYFVIDSSTRTGYDFWGYQKENPAEGSSSVGYVTANVADIVVRTDYIRYTVQRELTTDAFKNAGYTADGVVGSGYLVDCTGQRIDFEIAYSSLNTGTTSNRKSYMSITPKEGSPTTFNYYPQTARQGATIYSSSTTNYYIQPYVYVGADYLGVKEFVINSIAGSQGFVASGYYYSTINNDVSQQLYCMEADDKYYFWLFRGGYGSSLILEGKGTTGVPAVTITNGGRYYTDNYFVALDKYDAFGVEYGYSVQMSAFDSDSQVVTQTFTFGERGSVPGGSDIPIIIPPSVIEIPETVHSIISTPGQLPALNLPFDFTAPVLTLDLTSGFDTAFNSTWLGVNDAYTSTKEGIDSFVSSFAPKLSGSFADIVFTITTYVDSFRLACEEMRDTYAVPFFNLMVRISALVPSPVWIVFDIWLIYSAFRLIVWVFTCPLSDVIRRSF